MKLFDEDDGEMGANSEVITRKKRKLQVIEDDILVDNDVATVTENSYIQGNVQNFSENSALYNTDIFDAETSDDDLPAKDEIVREINYSENVNEENSVSPKHKRKKQMKDEKDHCRREGHRTGKEKDKELFTIFSENQRFLRESSVNLPYHHPPKRTLKEFLSERRKSVVSLTPKGQGSDPQFNFYQGTLQKTEPQKIVENSETKGVQEEQNLPQGNSSTEDDVPKTAPDLNSVSRETESSCEQFVGQHSDRVCRTSSDYLVNPGSNDSNLKQDVTDQSDSCDITQQISSEANLIKDKTENVSDPVNDSVLPSCASVEKSLASGVNCVPNEVTDLQRHAVQEKDMMLQHSSHSHDVMLVSPINYVHEENAVSRFMNDLRQDDPENTSHVKNDIVNSKNEKLEKSDMTPNTRAMSLCNRTEKANSVQELSFKNKILPPQVEVPSTSFFRPRITGAPNTVINLDDSDNENSPNTTGKKSDLESFMEKFVNHTKKLHRKHHAQEVNLNIVSKDPEKQGTFCRTTLKVSVNLPEKENSALKTPGAKLLALKEQLFSEITKKREAAVKKWQETDALDNEELSEGEEEEEELSEESEADDEDDSESEIEQITDNESNESEGEKNIFLDDEASESDGDDVSIPHLRFNSKQSFADKRKLEENSTTKEDILPDTKANEDLLSKEQSLIDKKAVECVDAVGTGEDSCSLRLFLESDSEGEITEVPVEEKSFDLTGSTIPPYQPYGGFRPDKFSSMQNEQETIDATHSTQSSEASSLRIPMSQIDGSQQLWPTQDSPNALQLFRNKQDSNGADLLNLMDGRESQTVVNDSILDVCSGKFTGSLVLPSAGSPIIEKESAVLSASIQADEHDKDELLALCSGNFTGCSAPGNMKLSSVIEEDDNFGDPINESSLPETVKVRFRPKVLSISDDEDEEENKVFDDDSVDCKANSVVNGMGSIVDEDLDVLSDEESFVEDKVKKISDFLEDEAELSGSDVGSEENEEYFDNDEYEEDVPDEELPSDEELRDQIGKVHFKNIMDEDKRELRLYQELFFEDGDLHSDGPGRQRKFTWKNTDNTFSGANDQNSESENEDVQEDEKWRIERHEREKWLQEQEENSLHGETSPVKMRSQSSVKIEIVNRVKESPVIVTEKKSGNRPLLFKRDNSTMNHHGSFLAKGQDFLAVLAKKLKKSDDNDATGSRTTKHFVFRAVSPKKVQPKVEIKEKIKRTPVSRFNRNYEKKTTASPLNKSVFDFFST